MGHSSLNSDIHRSQARWRVTTTVEKTPLRTSTRSVFATAMYGQILSTVVYDRYTTVDAHRQTLDNMHNRQGLNLSVSMPEIGA